MTVIGSDFNKTSWDYILKKPVEYTPKSHYHYLSDVIDLNEFLAEASTHTHTNKASIDKITEDEGVPLWNGGAWPSSVTSLAWTSITNKPTSFVPTTHTHAIADVNSLQETINSLALKAHTHAELHTHYNLTSIGKITESAGLPLWNGNAWPVSGSVDWANITDKPAAYTPSAHSHATSDITGLTNHTHANKALLDTYNQANADISDSVLLKHTHVNITTLNKVTENAGIPLWNGGAWPTSAVAWTNITGKPENIELTISNSHTHANKTTIDKITEAEDLPLWNGSAWPGTSDLSGYMTKAVYDTNNDGIVDTAEVANSVTWANVSNKPTSTITDIDLAVTNTHTHTNKTTIDRITESEDLPLWNGSAWPGTGDMTKSAYDTDGDNKVEAADVADVANSVTWANVSNKPTAVVADIDDAVSKKHAHTNISTLDLITYTPENPSNKNAANGYAGLDSSTKILIAQLPFKNSLVNDSDQLQLLGDSATPGNRKYYGTNASGTKGFYDLYVSPVLTSATLIPSTTGSFVTLYTNNTGSTIEIDFISITNTSATSRDVYLKVVESDGTTLVHNILPKTVLATLTNTKIDHKKYAIANGQILQCQTSGDLTEFYVSFHVCAATLNSLITYTNDTWTTLVNNTSGSSQVIDIISISNPSLTDAVSYEIRIVDSSDTLVNTISTTSSLDAMKVFIDTTSAWVLANTQKLQIKLSASGCDAIATTKVNA